MSIVTQFLPKLNDAIAVVPEPQKGSRTHPSRGQDDLIILSKLEKSKSEIRRLIKGSGVRINNQIINDEKLIISEKLFEDNTIKLSLGKKRHIKVEIN